MKKINEHFVTILDHRYLPQALCLFESLQANIGPIQLWVVCVDRRAVEIIEKLNMNGLTAIFLSDVAPLELCAVRDERTVGEFCWTATPFLPDIVFSLDRSIDRVTYVDADVWAYNNIKGIFEKFEESGRAVMITPHNYAPGEDQSDIAGTFCVQFLIFKRGLCDQILSRWKEQCLDWCFSKAENDRFGDQKYLDEWPELYPSLVYVWDQENTFLGPWNFTFYPPSKGCVFHFHGLKLLPKNRIFLGNHYIPTRVRRVIYDKYVVQLAHSVKKIKEAGYLITLQSKRPLFVYLMLRQIRSISYVLEFLLSTNLKRLRK